MGALAAIPTDEEGSGDQSEWAEEGEESASRNELRLAAARYVPGGQFASS